MDCQIAYLYLNKYFLSYYQQLHPLSKGSCQLFDVQCWCVNKAAQHTIHHLYSDTQIIGELEAYEYGKLGIWCLSECRDQTQWEITKIWNKYLVNIKCTTLSEKRPHQIVWWFFSCTVGKINTPIFSFFRKRVVNIAFFELRPLSNERSGNFTFYRGIHKFLNPSIFEKNYRF